MLDFVGDGDSAVQIHRIPAILATLGTDEIMSCERQCSPVTTRVKGHR